MAESEAFTIDRSFAHKIAPAGVLLQTTLRANCLALLNREAFRRTQFISYVEYMIQLLGGVVDKDGSIDSSEEPHDITAKPENFGLVDKQNRGGLRFQVVGSTGSIYAQYPNLEQLIMYIGKERLVPVLYTRTTINVPATITFRSYLTEEDKQVFPEGKYNFSDTKTLSEKGLQTICRNIFGIYQSQ